MQQSYITLFTALMAATANGLAVNKARTTDDYTVVMQYASFPVPDSPPDFSTLNYTDTPSPDHKLALRNTDCLPELCTPPGSCHVQVTNTLLNSQSGTWWTSWCNTLLQFDTLGAFAHIDNGFGTSITYSGEVSLAGPLSKFLNVKLGYSVTDTKFLDAGVGCTNVDNRAHQMWMQEEMGWANANYHVQIHVSGPEACGESTQFDRSIHADWPSPNGAQYRLMQPGCGSPVDNKGPVCNFNAPHL